jgi:gliding motility associated protien GldN
MLRINFLFTIFSYCSFCFGQNLGPSNVIIPQANGGGAVQPQSGVIDGVYEKKDVLAKKRAIPYEFVRENDYVWGKRTWSYIDLREKINHPLYFPHEEIDAASAKVLNMPQGRYSLYYVIQMALRSGYLLPYKEKTEKTLNNPIELKGGDNFSLPLQRDYSLTAQNDQIYLNALESECIGMADYDPTSAIGKTVSNSSGTTDSVYWLNTYAQGISNFNPVDPKLYLAIDKNGPYNLDSKSETTNKSLAFVDPNTKLPAPVQFCLKKQKFYQSRDIVKYLLKEDWFFDKERSVLDVRTIGIAPVIIEDSTQMNEKILFWLYFPQVRDVLKNYYVYDAKSTVGGNTFDHLFMTRRFNAVVYKESTLYDRKIEDYRFGADALYESEKVKNTIRTFEHDVWNF